MLRRKNSGFTLVEILIVVIILGILAAIVIPQFSNASQDARKSSLLSTVQTLRSQVALYKLQHRDTLPDLIASWDQFLKKTDEYGKTDQAQWAANAQPCGPYMQATPVNQLTNGSVVKQGDGSANVVAGADFVYDFGGGTGTGQIWGTSDTNGTLLKDQ